MSRIIFVKPFNSPFILVDQNILEKKFDVIPYVLKDVLNVDKGRLSFPWKMIKLVFFLLTRIRRSEAVVTWFADYHSMVMVIIARLFGKKPIIFAGGQEAVCYPELKKGVYLKKMRGMCVKYALKHASLIIPNHKSLIYHENYYYDANGKKDGIRYYIPGIKTKIEVIPNGYDAEKFKRNYAIKKNPKLILSIGRTITIHDIINKGFDLLSETARRNPQYNFIIIGVKKDHINWMEQQYKISELKNLTIHPFLEQDDLIKFYNEAQVFVQISITEGMPNTLAEAMLMECVPVGSNVNGIPDTIGDTGVIVYKRSVEELEKAILQALQMDTGKKARNHILKNFSLKKREEKIIEIIEKII